MKLVSFEAEGLARFGVIVDGGVADATGWLQGITTLKEALESGRQAELLTLTAAQPDFTLDGITFLPPIVSPRRIICVGVNYDEHRRETGRPQTSHPTLFTRWPSSLVGHQIPIKRPKVSERFDFEGELAVVIGRAGRSISTESALDYVAGYACFHDGTIRDFQRHTSQFTPGKNFDQSGGFGPWLVTSEDIVDPSTLELTTRLNGQVVQQSGTQDLIFDIPHLINYISTFTTLDVGDVIATGTPSGVGDKRKPPLYLKKGDKLEIEITGIGTLAHPVVEEA